MGIIIMTKFAVKQVLLICIIYCLTIGDLFSKYVKVTVYLQIGNFLQISIFRLK